MSENELMDSLLAVADPMAMLGSGPYRDDKTVPFNNLTPRERRTLVSGAGINFSSTGGNRDTQNQLLRYILEAEAASRKGNTSKAAKIHQNMRIFMGTRGVKFMSEVDEMTPTAEVEVTEEVTPVNGEAAPKTKKFAKAKKAVAKKAPAKKAVAKKAPAKKSAKAEALDTANADRKARLADKKAKGGDTPSARYSDDTVFAHVRAQKADEKVSGSNKRGSAIAAFIKEKGSVTQAEIVKQIPKLTETAQGPEKIWGFYRPLLLTMGLIKVRG